MVKTKKMKTKKSKPAKKAAKIVAKPKKQVKVKNKSTPKQNEEPSQPMRTCKVCGEVINPKRVQLGYQETCVKHSTAERFVAAISTVNMEGDTEISIIRDPKVAEELEQLHYIYQYR